MTKTLVVLLIVYLCTRVVLACCGKKPLSPICVKCHERPDVELRNCRGWWQLNGKVACLDHTFLDGRKLVRHLKVHTNMPAAPPSQYFFKQNIKDLIVDGLTKYEVFAARLGKKLKTQFPFVKHVRHTVTSRDQTGFMFGMSTSFGLVYAPVGEVCRVKTAKRKSWLASFILLIEHLLRVNYSVIDVVDWRMLYGILNIDDVCTYANGNHKSDWRVFLLQTDDAYYAVMPYLVDETCRSDN